jgi:hypothetical protein
MVFPFIDEIDKQLKMETYDSWMRRAVEDMPPVNEEVDVYFMGIRMARHVHNSECQRCQLGPYNHCPDALGMHWYEAAKQYCPIKVCLRDWFKWCAKHGYYSWIKEII